MLYQFMLLILKSISLNYQNKLISLFKGRSKTLRPIRGFEDLRQAGIKYSLLSLFNSYKFILFHHVTPLNWNKIPFYINCILILEKIYRIN